MLQSRVLRKIPIINSLADGIGRFLRGQKASFGIPTEPKVFRPFGPNISLWSRANELERLHALVTQSESAHIIVTGSSGAGKSTLVTKLYWQQYVEGSGAEYYQLSDYDHALIKFLLNLKCRSASLVASQQKAIASISQTLRDHQYPVTRSLDEIGSLPEAQHAWAQLEEFMSILIKGDGKAEQLLFVFDQVERYLFLLGQSAETRSGGVNALELYLIKGVLELLRQAPNCRAIFIIREDFLYRSLEFLLRGSSDATTDSNNVFRIFMCQGINPDSSPQAVGDIHRDFVAAVPFLANKAENFDRLTGLSSSFGANPFLTQLSGFMIEHFYRVDKRVVEFLALGRNAREVLPLFFAYVERDFLTKNPDTTNVQLLRSVLFGIALETRSTGLPVPAERAAAIAHVPVTFAKEVYDYLLPRRIVVAEEQETGNAVRFAHDLLAEFVVHSGEMSFDTILQEAQTKLSENHVDSKKLTTLPRWAHFVDDIGRPSIGFLAIWIFYVFGIFRIGATWGVGIPLWGWNIRLNPDQCAALESYIAGLLPPYEIFDTVSCVDSRWYYPVVFIVHCLFVTYIYVLDRNYIQHVARSRIIRIISAAMPVIGVTFGILFAFSPIVYVLPVTVVGTIYAFLLFYLGYSWRGAQDFSIMNMVRGSYTLGNMVFTVAFVLLVWATYPEGNPFVQWGQAKLGSVLGALGVSIENQTLFLRAFWLYISLLLMLYYWSSLRANHQSRLAAAKWLALFDRSRLLGGRNTEDS